MKVVGLEVVAEDLLGEGGFLVLRRRTLRNRRDDGSVSEPYLCDYATRIGRPDAVAVAIWRRGSEGIEVLVRAALRPAAAAESSLTLWEVVAGIIEVEDTGPDGVFIRAAAEVWEEAGYRVPVESINMLGASFYVADDWHRYCSDAGSRCQLGAASRRPSRRSSQQPARQPTVADSGRLTRRPHCLRRSQP